MATLFEEAKSEKTNYIIKSLCEDDNKIFYEGKCICDKAKGYYSINYKEFNNEECYKLEDLPKNIYFNEDIQSFELCYKTCGTCIKGGDFLENNCLTCASDLIKEPKNNSSNCVENCNYLYYYDSFNQYICTEDAQCPEEASLIVRNKSKCVNKCIKEDINKYQYNGECIHSCPYNTYANEYSICKINNTNICTTSEFNINLNGLISQENVKLSAKNYATEFYYTINHISTFTSSNFTMALYKNASCINELKLNITKIEYDSCIQQLKIDNNINKTENLIIAVIDIVNGNHSFTSYGFFNPDSGEKLDASKSCSDKNVMMYENILSVLNDPLALKVLENQKINIFDLNNQFYKDICFHFDSPNGKDATLKDRIKTFYPNITLCDAGCKNKDINLTTMKAECECIFQDLLSKNIFENDLFGNNVLIKESLEEIKDILNNLNLEVLMCYKDVFNYKYFKKNRSGFIILSLFILYSICIIYFYNKSKNIIIRYICSLTEKYLLQISKNNYKPSLKKKNKSQKITNCPIKKNNNNKSINKNFHKMYDNINDKMKKKILVKIKAKSKAKNKEKKTCEDISWIKRSKNKQKNKNKSSKNINFNQIKIINFNFKTIKKESKESSSSILRLNLNSRAQFNRKININNKSYKPDYFLINNDIDIIKFLNSSLEKLDYDDVVEEDKRTFWQYFSDKIKDNQILINIFFIQEIIKQKSIKFAILIVNIDIYFLTNGLFYSDSYISEVFNSKEKETFFSFIPRSIDRFIYSTILGKIIGYIIDFFFFEDIKIKSILLKNKDNILNLKYEISEIIKSIFKYIKILIIINYFLIIFSWYYLSCFNNAYPNINNEWIISSMFFISILQILPFIQTFVVACIRFASIQIESEKLFKLSLLLS